MPTILQTYDKFNISTDVDIKKKKKMYKTGTYGLSIVVREYLNILKYVCGSFFFFLTFAILKANMLDYSGTQYQFLCARF